MQAVVRVIFACVVCVSIGLLIASLRKVPSTEMGVQYNVHKKQLDDATKSGGLFLGPPGYRFIKFPSTFITVDVNNKKCVSNDGLLVEFSVTFQVRIHKCVYFWLIVIVSIYVLIKCTSFDPVNIGKYQMTTFNVLPAIVKYRDFHKWASIVEQAGKFMRT